MKKAFYPLLCLLLCCLLEKTAAENTSQGITLLALHPFDNSAFTQGLEMDAEGRLLLSTGLYGKSSLGYLDIVNANFEHLASLPYEEFGEGITLSPKGLWQLTWQNHKAYLRDSSSFEILESFPLETEGWGIAYDSQENVLLLSDGSNTIYLRSAEDFRLQSHFKLPYENLNELEYANGYLYANIWYSNQILKINLESQTVEKIYDFTEILANLPISSAQRQSMDVLNGIAHIEGKRFYIAGKQYPLLLEVILN